MIFDSDQDMLRKKRAIELFSKTFNYTFKKLDPSDVDYKIFNSDGSIAGYAEVVGRVRHMNGSYPLPVPAKKVVKLIDKRIPSHIIWSCEDGVIFGDPIKLTGTAMWGIISENELMIYYEKQKELKYIRFT